MSGSMSQADLVEDLKRSLHDSASVFNAAADADWLRFLTLSSTAMATKRPRTLLGALPIAADVDLYPLASFTDFAAYKTHLWGNNGAKIKPWSPCYPGGVPRISVQGAAGSWMLVFDPAPTAAQIAAYGSSFRFWYYGQHTVGTVAADTTLALADRGLVLLRAQAEAMRELSMRNINKPVQLRDGISGTPRNSTPAALYQALLAEWEDAK
jgi:hypothetical protein